MKKRILSTLVILAMVMGTLPTMAFADDAGDGTPIVSTDSTQPAPPAPPADADDNAVAPPAPAVDESGDAIAPPTDAEGNVVAPPSIPEPPTDEDGNVLEPQTDEDGNVIAPPNAGGEEELALMALEVLDVASGVTIDATTGAYTFDDELDASGTGYEWVSATNTLTITSAGLTIDIDTEKCDYPLTVPAGTTIILNGNLAINTDNSVVDYGICAYGDLAIKGSGDLTITGNDINRDICAYDYSEKNFCDIDIDVDGTITMKTVNTAIVGMDISISGDAERNFESGGSIGATGSVSIDGGTWNVQANDTVIENYHCLVSASSESIVIQNSTWNLAEGDLIEIFGADVSFSNVSGLNLFVKETSSVTVIDEEGTKPIVTYTISAKAQVYGDVILSSAYFFAGENFTFNEDATLTIPSGMTMDLNAATTTIETENGGTIYTVIYKYSAGSIDPTNGTLYVEGTLILPSDTVVANVPFDSISGSGTITIGESSYTTEGKMLAKPYEGALTLSADTAFDGTEYGFTWTKSEGSETYDTLTVDGLTINIDSDSATTAALTVPAGTTIILDGDLTINTDDSDVDSAIYSQGDLKIEGDGDLTIAGDDIGTGINANNDENDIYIALNGNVSIEAWYAIDGDNVTITGNANWTIYAVYVAWARENVSIDGGTWIVDTYERNGNPFNCIASSYEGDTIAIKDSTWTLNEDNLNVIYGASIYDKDTPSTKISIEKVTGLDVLVQEYCYIADETDNAAYNVYYNTKVYGDVILNDYFYFWGDQFTFDTGATLTIPKDMTLDLNGFTYESGYTSVDATVQDVSDTSIVSDGTIDTTNGKLIVNGTVVYPASATVDFTNISGSGTIYIGNLQYDTAGVFAGFGGLVFTEDSEAEDNEFYSWAIVDEDDADYILTIKKDMVINADGTNGLTVPMDTTIVLNGDLEINTSGYQESGDGYYGISCGAMQIEGNGTLNIVSSGNAIYGDSITITNATVYAEVTESTTVINVSALTLNGTATVVAETIVATGSVNVNDNASITADSISPKGSFNSDGTATVNAMVHIDSTVGSDNGAKNAYIVYGNVTMDESESYSGYTEYVDSFSFHSSCNWTINEGVIIDLMEMDSIDWTNANIINNGMIYVAEAYDETDLNFDSVSGDGYVIFTSEDNDEDDDVVYKSDGTKVNVIDNNDPGGWCLDDEVDEEVDEEDGLGYTWLKGEDDVYTLTIYEETFVDGGLYIDVDDAIVVVDAKLTVMEGIYTAGNLIIEVNDKLTAYEVIHAGGDLTIQGTGSLETTGISDFYSVTNLTINTDVTLSEGICWYGDVTINGDVTASILMILGGGFDHQQWRNPHSNRN